VIDFQLGDLVKTVNKLGDSRNPDYVKAGTIGEIVSIDELKFPYGVRFDNGKHWFLNADEIERLTPPNEV
jgi:hypothetical protein